MDSFHTTSPSHTVSDAEDGSSDGEMDWEEVVVPTAPLPGVEVKDNLSPRQEKEISEAPQGLSGTEAIEITIQRAKKVDPQRKCVPRQCAVSHVS